MRELRKQGKGNLKMTQEEAKKNMKKEDLQKVRNITDKYKGKSSNQVFEEILNEIHKEEKNGTLKKDDLLKFARDVSPMLNKEQNEKLNFLLKNI